MELGGKTFAPPYFPYMFDTLGVNLPHLLLLPLHPNTPCIMPTCSSTRSKLFSDHSSACISVETSKVHVRHTRVNNLSNINQVTSLNFLFNHTYVNLLSQQLKYSHPSQIALRRMNYELMHFNRMNCVQRFKYK
jgi:hypothetical protein